MDIFSRALGDAVRIKRAESGLTQNQVAENIHVEKRTILNIENYKGNPKLEVLFPLIRELQIDPYSVFYPEIENPGREINEFMIFLSQCNTEEVHFLLAACKGPLDVVRNTSFATLKE